MTPAEQILTYWKPDVVIYHSPCDDGFGAAWACWTRWGDDVQYLPGVYGKAPPDVAGKRVLVVDFSFKAGVLEEMGRSARSVLVLDHHKTAQEDLNQFPNFCFGADNLDAGLDGALPIWTHFDMGRSGARLAWDFCHPGRPVPELIRLIEDRDLWRFHYPQTRAVSLWLRSHPYEFSTWSRIAEQLDGPEQAAIVGQALAIEAFYDQKIMEIVRTAHQRTINGFSVPACNCSWAFASDVAHALLASHPEAPFAATYYDRGDGSRTFSLRSDDSRMDVSAVAKRYGGGGHRNAAGFEVPAP